MKIIILAAGKGTRLGNISKNNPKCLVKIDNISLIERNLKFFKNANLNPYLITGYKKEKLNFLKLPSIHNRDFENTNMLWSLYLAKELMNDDFMVCYSDILVNSYLINKLKKFNHGIGVLIDKNWLDYWKLRFDNPLDDAESLVLSENNDIIDIGKKVTNLQDIKGQYIGFFKVSGSYRITFKKKLIFFCESDKTKNIAKKAYITDFLQYLINNQVNVRAIPINGGWVEIDNPKDIEVAKTSGRLKTIDASTT